MTETTYERLLKSAEADHGEAVRLFKAGWNELQVAQHEIERRIDDARKLQRNLMAAEDGPRAALASSLNAIDAIWRAIKADDEQRMIRVWRFADAPEALRRLSANGGDEDWLAWVPPTLAGPGDYIPWLENGAGPFGVCSIDPYAMPDGSCVWIGCHA